MTTTQFHVVAARSELADIPQMHVELEGKEILLCRDGDNYHAVAYFCSHAEFTLEGGSIHNGCITCPYHGAEFSLTTGEVLAPPAWEPIETFPVRLTDEDTIEIGINVDS